MIKRNIYLMYAISFLTGMVFYASISTLYRQNAGITVFQITIIESISFILSLLLEIPFGILSDRIGYKKTMILSMTLFAISKIIFWKATNFYLFLLERIFLSFSVAGLSGVQDSVIYLSATQEKSHKIFGIYETCGTAGILLASAIYSLFIPNNFSMAAFLTLITYTVAAVLTFFLQEVKAPDNEPKSIHQSLLQNFKVLSGTLKNKKLIFFTIGMSFYGEAMALMLNFLNQVKYTALGLSYRTISIIYIVVTAIGLLSFASESFTKIFGKKLSLLTSLLTGIISMIVFAFTKNAFIAIGFILLFTIMQTLTNPLVSQIYNENITDKDRATAMSMLNMVADFITVFIQLTIGRASDINITTGILTGTVSCIIGFTFITCSFHATKN